MAAADASRLVAILGRLVAFRTLPEQPNVDLLDYVAGELRRAGIESERVLEPGGDRGSLAAVVGPPVPGGVVLSAHSDVVAVEGQQWSVPPWELTAEGGRLFGRGTADMKGFIACCLELLPRVARKLKRPLILAISHDEEIGCKGAPLLVRHIAAQVPRPAAVIVGEPTAMQVVAGHKGVAVFETRVRGSAAHSSLPHTAASAIGAAARLVTYIEGMAERKRARPQGISGFTPPYTTMNVGLIRGGEASNIVAAECTFRWDVRALPGEDAAAVAQELQHYANRDLLPKMRSITPDADVVTAVFASAPPLSPDGDPAARDIAMRVGERREAGLVSFTTEAGLFQEAGMSAVVCGPGSIEQAHKPDEYIERSQLEACSRALYRLAAELSR